jgi:Mor family transcriptional regulator
MYAPLIDIIKAVGLPAAMKLVEHFGGTRIYIPLAENVETDNDVAKVIGLEATKKLAAIWGGRYGRPSIPLASRHYRDLVKSEIQRDSAAMTVPELARKYQTTERNIYRYLGESGKVPEAKQAGLF